MHLKAIEYYLRKKSFAWLHKKKTTNIEKML
jgi:hypothetical protein